MPRRRGTLKLAEAIKARWFCEQEWRSSAKFSQKMWHSGPRSSNPPRRVRRRRPLRCDKHGGSFANGAPWQRTLAFFNRTLRKSFDRQPLAGGVTQYPQRRGD
jgi:hypothetical protein